MNKLKNSTLLTEVDDMYLGDKTGASWGTAIGIAALLLSASNIASQKYSCGVVWSCSAECRKDGKAC